MTTQIEISNFRSFCPTPVKVPLEPVTAMVGENKVAPPERWHSRFLGKQPTEDDIKRMFQENVQGEVNRVKTDFESKVFTAYKDVTCSTFKDPKFRELIEDRFGQEAIERIFREHDAFPGAATQ